MKILHVVPSYKPAYIYGGPIESVARMCEELVRAGHTVEVFTTTANGAEELKVAPGVMQIVDGVRVTYFKRITKDPTHVSPDLWKKLQAEAKHYDVVHIHSWWNILVIVAAWICHRQKVKVVLSPRGMLSHYILNNKKSIAKNGFHSLIGKKLLRKTYFHATAPAEEEECLKLIPGWKGFEVPNIIRGDLVRDKDRVNQDHRDTLTSARHGDSKVGRGGVSFNLSKNLVPLHVHSS